MKSNFMDDIIVIDEDLVDINYGDHYSSGNDRQAKKSKKNKEHKSNKNGKNGDKKKKIIIISSVAAAVVVALGITGFCLLGDSLQQTIEDAQFKFADGTSVSGISISGQTMEQAKSTLEANKNSFINPIEISVDANGKITKLTQDNFEYTYNIDEVLEQIKRDEAEKKVFNTSDAEPYTVSATITDESVEKNVNEISKKTDKNPVNARVSKFNPYSEHRFEYQEAVDGCKMNAQDLTEKIKSAVKSGAGSSNIVASVETSKAKINSDDLKKNIVKLASYETVSYNTANGTTNMRVSLAACNGSVIEPGAVWSFNDCTGNSNLESNGYKPAHVIENGELTDGIGGGICQSSSTIYNAAVRSNLDIEERHEHKWASSYVPTGLDATIDYGHLDLKLSNPTEYQMFLECKLVDSTLYVTFWGYKSPAYDEIKTHNEMVSKKKDSYTVKAWRVYLKDGKEVDRESLGSSTYDSEHGYVFIEADHDNGAKYTNVDDLTEPPTSKSESSQSKPTEPKPTAKPTTPKPTEPKPTSPKPTEPKPTEQEPTEPVHTDPTPTDPTAANNAD